MKQAFYCSWKIFTFVLIEVSQFLRGDRLDFYRFPVFKTSWCPKSHSEWKERSNVLNCTKSNGYFCIPNANLTHLLEFCFNIPRTPVEKGICLMLDASSNLDDYSCASFISGCPPSIYWSDDVYKYQECLSVLNGCFLAEPKCVKERSIKNENANFETEMNLLLNLLWIISGITISIFLIFGAIVFTKCWRFQKVKEQRPNIRYKEMRLTSLRHENDNDRVKNVYKRCNSDETNLYGFGQPPLFDMMLKKYIDKTKQIVEYEIRRTNELFVKTKGYLRALEVISSENYAVIKGNMGDGKTTIACHVIKEKIKEGKHPLQIYNIAEFDQLVSNEKNLVIFIDNMFGEFSTTEVSQWSSRFRALEAAVGSNCLIITIRNDIYNQLYFTSDHTFFLEKAMIDISFGGNHRLTMDEKRQLFAKYSPDLVIPNKILEDSSIMGFPQCCRVLKDSPHFEEELNSLFLNPEFLRKDITKRIMDGGMKAAMLAFISLKGGKVKKTELEDSNIDEPLKTSVMNIFSVEKNFVKFADTIADVEDMFVIYNNEEETYEFSHSSVQIALFLAIGKNYPEKFIKHCHYDCLSVVTTKRCSKKELQTLCLSDKYLEVLGNRIRDLLSGQEYEAQMLRVISELPVWEDNNFLNMFLKNSSENYCEKLDENNWSLLVHFAVSGCLDWIQHIFENELRYINNRQNDKSKKDQGILALANACGANNIRIVNYLINSGISPDITCCFHAVKGGHMDIVNILVKCGVDLQTVSKSLSRWDTKTTVLEEAALQKQDHLMIPLLKICPELTNIKSSIGASAVHFAASAGNIELLQSLIKEFNFTPYDISNIGSSILHFASQNNRIEAVKWIVEKYPRLFEKEYYCYEQGTVLHTAAQSANFELFEYLYNENIRYLDNLEEKNVELTRGCYVLIKGEKRSIVNKSSLLHVRSDHGLSLLHRAAEFGCIRLIDFLIKSGLDDLSCTFVNDDEEEFSVFDVARNKETHECLEKHLEQLQNKNISEDCRPSALSSESLNG